MWKRWWAWNLNATVETESCWDEAAWFARNCSPCVALCYAPLYCLNVLCLHSPSLTSFELPLSCSGRSYMTANLLPGRLTGTDCWKIVLIKESFDLKSEDHSAHTGLYMTYIAIHLLPFWLQTIVVIDSNSFQRLFPSICWWFEHHHLKWLCSSIGNWVQYNLELQFCTGFNKEHVDQL